VGGGGGSTGSWGAFTRACSGGTIPKAPRNGSTGVQTQNKTPKKNPTKDPLLRDRDGKSGPPQTRVASRILSGEGIVPVVPFKEQSGGGVGGGRANFSSSNSTPNFLTAIKGGWIVKNLRPQGDNCGGGGWDGRKMRRYQIKNLTSGLVGGRVVEMI